MSAPKPRSKKQSSAHSSSSAAASVSAHAAPAATATPGSHSTSAHATSSSAVPLSQAMLAQLASRIDHLEGATPGVVDDSHLTHEEGLTLTMKLDAIKAASAESATPVDTLLALLKSEMEKRTIAERQLADRIEKLNRSLHQRVSLENLCKELQSKNKRLGEDVRNLSNEQIKNHEDMRSRFETNLSSIQAQIDAQSAERLGQAKENDTLREQLKKILNLDSVREQHFDQQLKTKELELKLAEAKLAQSNELGAQEANRAKLLQDRVEKLSALESTLRSQLGAYAEKFDAVQTTLTKSNELFGSYKAEMERSSAAIKKSESEKLELQKSTAAAQLKAIQMAEERIAEQAATEKLKRQNAMLTNLCKELQARKEQAAAVATTDDAGKENDRASPVADAASS